MLACGSWAAASDRPESHSDSDGALCASDGGGEMGSIPREQSDYAACFGLRAGGPREPAVRARCPPRWLLAAHTCRTRGRRRARTAPERGHTPGREDRAECVRPARSTTNFCKTLARPQATPLPLWARAGVCLVEVAALRASRIIAAEGHH